MDFHFKSNTMRYLNFSKDSEIILEANFQCPTVTTPAKAINEAIQFVKENGLKSVDLNYGGFTMYIDPDVEIKQLVSEFYHWRSIQTAP